MTSILENMDRGVGTLTLNRPSKLNCLDLELINDLERLLGAWAVHPDIHLVLIRGSGERAFCAGGDLELAYKAMIEGDEDLLMRFFHNDYLIGEVIGRFTKPLIVLATHITMGAGMGICMMAPYRIVSDKSCWSMPETQIGFFPDVGAGFFLNKCPGHLGLYLALTGDRMNAADAVYAGLATHYLAPEVLELFEETLKRAPTDHQVGGVIEEALSIFVTELPMESNLQSSREIIDRCFAEDSVPNIIAALQEESAPWVRSRVLPLLNQASPLSLLVTFEYMKRCRSLSLQEVLNLDYGLSTKFWSNPDFTEGIRAQIIDKDKSPQWSFAHVTDVPVSLVRSYS